MLIQGEGPTGLAKRSNKVRNAMLIFLLLGIPTLLLSCIYRVYVLSKRKQAAKRSLPPTITCVEPHVPTRPQSTTSVLQTQVPMASVPTTRHPRSQVSRRPPPGITLFQAPTYQPVQEEEYPPPPPYEPPSEPDAVYIRSLNESFCSTQQLNDREEIENVFDEISGRFEQSS